MLIGAPPQLSLAAHPLARVFVTLGRRSLGALVLHTYGVLALAHLPAAKWLIQATIVQLTFVAAIVVLLNARETWRNRRRRLQLAPAHRLAA